MNRFANLVQQFFGHFVERNLYADYNEETSILANGVHNGLHNNCINRRYVQQARLGNFTYFFKGCQLDGIKW